MPGYKGAVKRAFELSIELETAAPPKAGKITQVITIPVNRVQTPGQGRGNGARTLRLFDRAAFARQTAALSSGGGGLEGRPRKEIASAHRSGGKARMAWPVQERAVTAPRAMIELVITAHGLVWPRNNSLLLARAAASGAPPSVKTKRDIWEESPPRQR